MVDGAEDRLMRVAPWIEHALVLIVEHLAAVRDRRHAARAGRADAFGPIDLDRLGVAGEPPAQERLDLRSVHLDQCIHGASAACIGIAREDCRLHDDELDRVELDGPVIRYDVIRHDVIRHDVIRPDVIRNDRVVHLVASSARAKPRADKNNTRTNPGYQGPILPPRKAAVALPELSLDAKACASVWRVAPA